MASPLRHVAATLFAASLVTTPTATAHGQVTMVAPIIGPPRVSWLGPPRDGSGAAGDTQVPSFLLDPIRLSLLGTAVPHASNSPGCGDPIESAGAATGASSGIATQRISSVHLIPQLTLVGFSRGGCAADGAVGGALVYATPIAKNIFLVGSLGFMQLPHGAGGNSITRSDVRADVVFARPNGRSYAVGVGTRGFTFGGSL